MSAGSARDRQFAGRRQNGEAEPFLVQEIAGSPVMRGRRQNSDEERFLVEDIPGSPIMRGRVPRVVPSARSCAGAAAGPPGNAPTRGPELNSTSDAVDGPIRMTPTASQSSSNSYATANAPPRSLDNDDAPPSYESSIPPTQIGWSTDVTSVPFPMPFLTGHDGGRAQTTFSYPPPDSYPPIGLSALAKSYQSIESSKSKSFTQSSSPSPCSSPDRCRPAYTYQYRSAVRTPPPRPRFRIDNEGDRYVPKPQNDFSYKYGAIVIAIVFVAFLMLLSLGVKFVMRNSFRK